MSSSTQLIQGSLSSSLEAVSKIPVHIPDEADSVSGERNEDISTSAHNDSLHTLNDSEIIPIEMPPDISSLQYLTHQISNQYDAGDILAREKAISTCKKMELALRDCTNIEAIRSGKKHLDAGLTLVTSLQHHDIAALPVKKKPAANAQSKTQVRFFSTKKKRKVKPRLAKPKREELTKCIEDFEDLEVDVCAVCFRENDKKISGDVDWVQCQICDMWYHQSCVGTNVDLDYFTCPYC
jgi:hypothetical protein